MFMGRYLSIDTWLGEKYPRAERYEVWDRVEVIFLG